MLKQKKFLTLALIYLISNSLLSVGTTVKADEILLEESINSNNQASNETEYLIASNLSNENNFETTSPNAEEKETNQQGNQTTSLEFQENADGRNLAVEDDVNSWIPDTRLQELVMTKLGLSDSTQITKALLSSNDIYVATDDTIFPLINNFTGLEYIQGLSIEDIGNYSFDKFNALFSDTLKAKTSLMLHQNLAKIFPSGINFTELSQYANVGFDPHNTYHTTKTFSLDQNNYKKFYLSYDEIKMFNVSGFSYIYPSSLQINNKYISYKAEAKDNGIEYTLDTSNSSPDLTYEDLAGLSFSNSEETLFPDGPYTQCAIESNNPQSPNVGGYINITYAINFAPIKQATNLTVKYLDNEGNTIAEDKTIDGYVGEDYDVSTATYQLSIDGYTLNAIPENAKGVLTDQPQTVTYVYTKNVVPIQTHTVQFDSNGGSKIDTQLVEDQALLTKPTNPSKAGYIFKGWYVDKNLTTAYDFGVAITSDMTLYAKWEKDNQQNTDNKAKNQSNPTAKTTNQSANSKKTALPATGENNNTVNYMLVGISIMTIATYFFITKKRKIFNQNLK